MKNLIIGGGGQDGRILARKLALDNQRVLTIERSKNSAEERKKLLDLISHEKPERIFNLAGFSSVWRSWKSPSLAVQGNLNQLASLFEVMEETKSNATLLLASSSELFDAAISEVNETTEMKPRSPYAVTKKAAVDLALAYREAKGFDIRIVHLFNHESPLRGVDFVTQKIAAGVASVKLGKQSSISLGNLSVSRDWGYAPDSVQAMIEVMNQEAPDDYVVGTGKLNSLEDLVRIAFEEAGLGDWQSYVEISEENLRPNDHEGSRADSSKLRNKTGWQAKREFPEIIAEMVQHQILKQSGKSTDEIWLDGITN